MCSVPVGSTFNIQNSIPHKSQKTKAVPEANRAAKFQRVTAGSTESIKEAARCSAEHTDICLGPSGRGFKSLYSDQHPQEHRSWGCFLCLLRRRIWGNEIKQKQGPAPEQVLVKVNRDTSREESAGRTPSGRTERPRCARPCGWCTGYKPAHNLYP